MEHTKNEFTGEINTWKTSLTEILNEYGFNDGRMISFSKSQYYNAHENNIVFFNACIYDENLVQVWYGDLDITLDSDKLNKVAEKFGRLFYVTRESYRSDFAKLKKSDLEENNENIIKFIPINNEKNKKTTIV